MTSWPILSVVTFLPIVGAIFIAFLNDDEAGVRNARWIALWTTLITFAISLILVWRFDPGSADFQFLEKRPWLGGAITYSMGVDGISLPFVILTTALMPICDPGELDLDPDPRALIHDLLPGARDPDGRHLLRARSGAVLSVLRGRPDPDVPDHRRVGRAAPGLCELQVLSLHASGLGADAARHHGDVLAGRHHRHPDAAASRLPARAADLGLVCLPRLVRGQDADVAGAHLAARRARRGADRRLGDPRRDPAQARRLWLPALLAADVPASVGRFRAA